MNTDLIILLIMLAITLIAGIITMIMHLCPMDDKEACNICPHIGLMICHSCTHEDRERILKLYKNGGTIL